MHADRVERRDVMPLAVQKHAPATAKNDHEMLMLVSL